MPTKPAKPKNPDDAWANGPAKALTSQLLTLIADAVGTKKIKPEDAMRAASLLPSTLLELMRGRGWITWSEVSQVMPTEPEPRPQPPSPMQDLLTSAVVVALIRDEAARQGVPLAVALAFADLESKLNPNAEGDLKWHEREQGARYKKHVLANKRLAKNPARLEPQAWHSYGLFQLLAPWHVDADQHPQSLLDPTTNVRKGIAAIKQALRQAKGDPYGARLAYVGCGVDGSACDAKTVRGVREKLQSALERWERRSST